MSTAAYIYCRHKGRVLAIIMAVRRRGERSWWAEIRLKNQTIYAVTSLRLGPNEINAIMRKSSYGRFITKFFSVSSFWKQPCRVRRRNNSECFKLFCVRLFWLRCDRIFNVPPIRGRGKTIFIIAWIESSSGLFFLAFRVISHINFLRATFRAVVGMVFA